MFSEQKLLFLCPAAICLAAALAIMPMLLNGVPRGNDLMQHYQFALTVYDSLQNGEIYPTWSAPDNEGYGGVGLRFYPPLSYYVLAAGKIVTGDWLAASFLAFWFWLALGGQGVYFWSRQRFSNGASVFAGILYVAAPYHLNEIYNAFTYAEFAAAGILPFCFAFVDRICRTVRSERGLQILPVIGLAVSYAALILTHLPLTVIGSLALGIYAVCSLALSRSGYNFLKLASSVLISLLLSAFYWVRLVTEMKWLNHATDQFAKDSYSYDYKINFLLMLEYLRDLKPDSREMWFADLMLIATLSLFVPFFIVFLATVRRRQKISLLPVTTLFLFALFLSTPLSMPVWDNLTFLQKVQFPWRWLAVISMSGVVFAAAGFNKALELFSTAKRPLILIAFGAMLFGVTFSYSQVIKQAMYHEKGSFNALVESYSDEKNYECWLPVWAKFDAFKTKEKVTALGREVSNVEWKAGGVSFTTSGGEQAEARLALFHYPYWQVKINGETAVTFPDEHGALKFGLPNEAADIRVEFIEPAVSRAALLLSLSAWALLAVFGVFQFVGLRNRAARIQ